MCKFADFYKDGGKEDAESQKQSGDKEQKGLVRLRVPGDLHCRHRAERYGNQVPLVDAFCYFNGGELYVKNMHVAEYFWGSWGNHEPRRDRKLLLTRKELGKLQRAVKEKGLTIVAVKLFIADNGYAKLLIALARGKKEYDKRQSIKEKDLRREMERM